MKIGLEWVKKWLEEEIQSLHKQRAIAIQELDKIKLEISDQREGKTQVSLERRELEHKIPTLLDILRTTQELLTKWTIDFYKLTDSQQQTIKELQKEIDNKVSELHEYEEKTKQIIDIDAWNIKYKEQLSIKSEELKDIIATLELTRKENDRIKDENKQFEIYKEKEMEKISRTHKALKERQQKIDAYRNLLQPTTK